MRGRDERGAALVEAAIVFPLLMLLLFGIIEYGLVFKNGSTYSASTRSGARSGAASSRMPGFHDTVARAVESTIADASGSSPRTLYVYRADPSTGNPWGGQTYETCVDCFEYGWDGSRPAGQRWVLDGTAHNPWTYDEQRACGNASTDVIGVRVEGSHAFITRMFPPGRVELRERSVMRLEPQSSISGSGCEPTTP